MDAIARQLDKARRALDEGSVDRAIAIAREMARRHPRAAEPLHFLGHTYCIAGKFSAALPYLRRAAGASPDIPQFRKSLARALTETGLIDEAMATARGAVELERSNECPSVDGHMLLGGLCCRAKLFSEAETCFRAAVDLLPSDSPPRDAPEEAASLAAAAHNDLANVLIELGRPDEAIRAYRRALAYAPAFADAWTNLASTMLALGRIDDAADAARRAVSHAPRQTAAWLTLGNALSELGSWAEAQRAFDALLSLEPLSLAARYNRSLTCLALGEWSAWDDYRLRHTVEPTVGIASGLPRWGGESLAGRTVLVRREQGIGTQIMFSGYLPALANAADRVIVECDPRMQPLFERAMPGIDFAPSDRIFSNSEDRKVDDRRENVQWRIARPHVEVAIGDLPAMLSLANSVGNWADGISPPRLRPDAVLLRKWRERLSRLGAGLCVGVSWRGGGTATARKKRSTTLEQWSPVLSVGGVRFVSLQYGDCETELAEQARRGKTAMHGWTDFNPRDDLDDLAALAGALDLVVSIDNSTVHLAGAVGVPLWVLLPAAADWRWQVDRVDTPWYPTARLIRQPDDAKGWPPLFSQVARQLERFVAHRRGAVSRVG